MLLRRRPPRAAAVVGLLAGLALLLAAVVDGGMTSPTRAETVDAVAAVPHAEVGAAPLQAREDHPAWSAPVLPMPTGALLATGTGALVVAVVVAVAGPRHRAPALLAVRHRGPPAVV